MPVCKFGRCQNFQLHVVFRLFASSLITGSYTRDVEGRSALVHAIRSGHAECCAELVQAPHTVHTTVRPKLMPLAQVLKNSNALSAIHQPGM